MFLPLASTALIATACGDNESGPTVDDGGTGVTDTRPDTSTISDAADAAIADCSMTSSGLLDPSFGQSGYTRPVFGLTSGLASATSVLVDSSSRIVMVGDAPSREDPSISAFAAIRLLPNGSLDPSFGSGGRVLGCPSPGRFCWLNDVAMQSDGKLIGVGGFNDVNGGHVALVRFESDGALDTAFGSGGVLVDYALEEGQGVAVGLDSQDRIVVAAYCVDGADPNSNASHFTTIRYLPSGARDPSFGANGVAARTWANGQHAPFDLVLQPDGRAVVVGAVRPFGGVTSSIGVARYQDNGALDGSFGVMGQTALSLSDASFATGVAMDSANRLLLSAQTMAGGALVRLSATGAMDLSFGTSGIASSTNVFEKPLILPDGRVVVGGYASISTTDVRLAASRYLTTGALENVFGGSSVPSTSYLDIGRSLAVQGDGGTVVVGARMFPGDAENSDFVAVRYCP